VACSIPSG
jgi:hypothetical protein